MADAWAYYRVSQESDASISVQKESASDYAKRAGLSLRTALNEGTKTSGFDNDREKYQFLKSKIRDGAVDVVITRDRARLSRDFDERLRLIALFRETGVEWHVVEAGGRLHLEDVQQAGFEALHAMMDHYKKMVEIERSRAVVEKRLEQGFDHGKPPFGLTFDDAKEYWVPQDGEFDTALEVIELRESGKSWREVTNATGVTKSQARGIVGRKERYLEEA